MTLDIDEVTEFVLLLARIEIPNIKFEFEFEILKFKFDINMFCFRIQYTMLPYKTLWEVV